MEKKFHFFADSLSIEKAKDKDGNEIMRLGGIASTKDKDADGEFLDPTGFDTSYFENEGVVNWHHGAKNNPETIIGEPTKVEMRPEGMYVEVDLYKDSSMGKKVYELAKTLEKSSKTRRLGFSIEGKALLRDSMNKNIIKKASITGLAITHMPKNPNTFAQIIKGEVDLDINDESSDLSEKELMKALNLELNECKIALADQIIKASSAPKQKEEDEEGLDKAESTEGTSKVLAKESVDKKLKELTKGEVYQSIFQNFPGINTTKAKQINLLIQKIAQMADRKAPTEVDIQKAMDAFGVTEDNTLEKAIEIGELLIGDGHDINDLEQILLSKGYDENLAKEASEKMSKKTAPKEAEDTDQEDDDDEDDDYEPKEKTMKKGYDDEDGDFIQKALSDMDEKQNEIAKATGTVLQKILADFEGMNDMVKGLADDLSQIRKGSAGRKSVPSAAAVDNTFGKIEKAAGGEQSLLSVKSDKKRILDILEKGAMNGDSSFEKALSNFEINGMLPADIVRRIQTENKVTLTN